MKFSELIKQNILFDSHCHLNVTAYDSDRDQVIQRANEGGVTPIIDIATDLVSSKRALNNARLYKNKVCATAGIDPEVFIPGNGAYRLDDGEVFNQFSELTQLVKDNREEIIMLGETGLDLYWNEVNQVDKAIADKSNHNQEVLFKKHIELAVKYDLPLTVHSREAVDKALNMLGHYKVQCVFHSLTPEGKDNERTFERKVREILERHYIISLNGIVTYKSATILRDTVIKVLKEKYPDKTTAKIKLEPIDFYNAGFIFETDGPYLAPEGKRGERSEPMNIKDIYEILVDYYKH